MVNELYILASPTLEIEQKILPEFFPSFDQVDLRHRWAMRRDDDDGDGHELGSRQISRTPPLDFKS